MVTIFSVILLKEKFTKYKFLGLTLAAAGAVILLTNKARFELGNTYIVGNLLILLNATSFGLYLVLIKPLLSRYHPITVIKWVFTFAAPVILMYSFSELKQVEFENFSNYAWGGLAYVIVFATFFTYSFNAYAIKVLTPVIAGLYLYLQPFITSSLSVLLDRDTLDSNKILAGVFILTGLYFAAFRKSK